MRVISLIVLGHILISCSSRLGVFARPTARNLPSGITKEDDVLLLDAPGFPDPKDPRRTLAAFQLYVFKKGEPKENKKTNPIVLAVAKLLSLKEDDFNDGKEILKDRSKLFNVKGQEGKTVDIRVPECSGRVSLLATPDKSMPGFIYRNPSIGNCGHGLSNTAAELVLRDKRKISATVYISPNEDSGLYPEEERKLIFGLVLLDIDETIKVTKGLKFGTLQNTFLEKPQPIQDMPELYASLSKPLDSPIFIYVSASMVQLYPFLRGFIHDWFRPAIGPVFLRKFTFKNVFGIFSFPRSKEALNYKLSVIDDIHGMYPNKKFLAVGDSTQKDPEVYATAFVKYENWITCIWIPLVDNTKKSDKRFKTAFAKVPQDRYRLFTDSEILDMRRIDVAGGKC
ncbi:hypothetical protein AMATHDRAFT_3576 [Amanita thiersii Skay4041]|uniref:Phosphatidate phosphatase APP1 catalytic domain-containing protein n=1 Tax=Amanita thiersii Skay4041 TaxID=703135 RepID=A0A2A9NJS3_9AGAR|nr:hypothetical protein AMATHDRAFT_3576 [Amanita thiersii Skay4041]